MNLGFGREKRLLTPKQFKAVFDSAKYKVPSKSVLLLARDNQLGHPRLGLVIGKKSVKLAVERNRIKRQIRESFRLNQDLLSGIDIVIVARRGIADLSNIELKKQFDKMWKRLARQVSTTKQTAKVDSTGQANA
ncbi:ribonuclease P protein component [Denitrificimonas sp. JX-1]|uniref:Ribonuclease P protein component n=1 Tax=Denitrificimonas halotolerans TaxID=3098930 RepID=A0ABU5GSG9_9GAMM|nr:ribonuclease P protein component [Denitrificimonas sp. JX-1]MDY7219824.1 ribonuclease P protein component [Denitrificimonas sp. JX-1]